MKSRNRESIESFLTEGFGLDFESHRPSFGKRWLSSLSRKKKMQHMVLNGPLSCMSTKIIDFSEYKPEVAYLLQQQQKDAERYRLQRLKALSYVRTLVDAARDLVDGPDDDFSRDLVQRLVLNVERALDEGWLK